jgi:hypothetical protein
MVRGNFVLISSYVKSLSATILIDDDKLAFLRQMMSVQAIQIQWKSYIGAKLVLIS